MMRTKVFVEIGVCDFDTLEPLQKNGWQGYYVEPVEEYANKIKGNVTQCAISSYDGMIDFYVSKTDGEEGTVYIVCGNSASKKDNPGLQYPAMYYGFGCDTCCGSLVLDIEGTRLDGKFVTMGGGVLDEFTIFKKDSVSNIEDDEVVNSFDCYPNPFSDNIYIDINFLNTLTRAEIQSGFGEMCHYFLVSSKKDFDDYKLNYNKALSDQSLLPKIISRSLLIKKKYIEIDEFDQNERQIFNYGHSFGHAIESLTNYKIPHGIAVSFGMDMANFISVKMGFLKESIRKDIREFLKQIWCGYNIENLDIDKFCNALSKDKKNIGDELRLILFKDYGKAFKTPVKNNSQFHDWLVEYFNKELLQ